VFAGPQITPVPGQACYDAVFGNVYQTIVTGTTFDYDVNYSGLYTDLACSNKSALGGFGSCTLRSGGLDYPRGYLFSIITYMACPLDTYLPLLMIILGGFGFYMLRKRSLNIVS
jgi:hypothetical protein